MENKNIIVIAVLIVVVGVIFSVGSKDTVSEKLATPEVKQSTSNELKDGFMGGCMENKDNEFDSVKLYDYCSCSYDKLETKLGKDGIVDFGTEYNKTGKLPEGTIETISECMYKIL